LANGRKNFQIDPLLDNLFLFGDQEEEKTIRTRLKRAQALSLPMHLVWWGQYGIGKTHRLRHTARVIKDEGFNFDPYYVICGDIHDKTGFDRLHYQMVSVLDMKIIRVHVTDYILKIRNNPGSLPSLDDLCGTSVDVKAALKQFGSDNDIASKPAWQFLCGLETDNPDAVGVTRPKLELTGDFEAVFRALATIVEAQTGKQLFYFIDETEKLTRITNKTAEAAWNETLRAILDIKNLNLVMSVGAEKLDQLPKLILMPDIVRRIQKTNYVIMESFKVAGATTFVDDLLKKWINPVQRDALAAAEKFTDRYPDYVNECYPFVSKKAFGMFIENVTVDAKEAKPSVILERLNTAAAEAFFRKEKLITTDLLADLNYA